MITYTSQSNYFTATIQADYHGVGECSAYSLSRTMLRMVRVNTPKLCIFDLTKVVGGVTSAIGSIYTDPDGAVEIPLRNTVNSAIAEGVTSFQVNINLREVNGNSYLDTLVLAIYVFEGISYNDALAPLNKQCEGFLPAISHAAIVPPTIMFNPAVMGGTLQGKGIITESNIHNRDKSSVWAYAVSGVSSTITPTGGRLNQLEIPYNADSLILTSSDLNYTRTWKLMKTDYCTDLVVVRWTSLTGAVRQHYFPIMSFINANDKEVNIISAGNGYDVRKNAYKGVRCRITGLTSYDCWYYQDLLQSSDAHAVVMPTYSTWATEIASMETAVFVEGGVEETPSGNGFYAFEFTLKLRHYDTI